MNLRELANDCIQCINPDREVIWKKSNGYTIVPPGKQIPSYVEYKVKAQIQAINSDSLQQTNGTNIQGVMCSVYMHDDVAGAVRPDERGGDLLLFSQIQGGPVQTWKVVSVAEAWPGWSHITVVLQDEID